jgi:DNA-binding response OmpR family regulator
MSPSILIVEDDAEICNLLVEALGELGGYATYVACSINMARVSMRRPFQGPDLILLDTQLPDGNGINFCATLRQECNYLPVIILSGQSTDDDIERAFEAGADDYLVKPFSISTLLAHVDAQLRHGGPKRDRRIVPRDRYTSHPYTMNAGAY